MDEAKLILYGQIDKPPLIVLKKKSIKNEFLKKIRDMTEDELKELDKKLEEYYEMLENEK